MVFSSDKKIKIDNDLYQKLQQLAERDGYSSVDEFVKHVLERETRKLNDDQAADQEEMEKQLRGLGYIE